MQRAERHTRLEVLPQFALVGDVGARVDLQRVLGADPQHHRRPVGHDRRLAVPSTVVVNSPLPCEAPRSPVKVVPGAQPGVGAQQIARLDVELVAVEPHQVDLAGAVRE